MNIIEKHMISFPKICKQNNCCIADPENAAMIIQCGGIPLVIQCLSSSDGSTVSISICEHSQSCPFPFIQWDK